MKYSQWIGIGAAAVLVASCFMNWAWYPDLKMHFTGFFTYQNWYGKPGKFLSVFAAVAVLLFLLPKLWAKRWNLLVNAITLAYAIFSFINFSRCYGPAICPERSAGIWVMLGAAGVMMLMALLPDLDLSKLEQKEKPKA